MTDDSGTPEEASTGDPDDDPSADPGAESEALVDADTVVDREGPEGASGRAQDGPAEGEASAESVGESSVGSDAQEATGSGGDAEPDDPEPADDSADDGVPEDVRKYERFKKVDGAQYERVNEFLRDRTYVTAREWAIARLCADFRTETGVEMTKIGENLPELVPFMTDTYSPQAVNQARASFEDKVRTAGATFLYGAMCDFFTAEELDEVMYEVTEVAKFLLEVEGVDLAVEDELEAEDRISTVMREVREASEALRYEECPSCGHDLRE